MTKSKEEIIKVQVGEKVFELTGADKEAFLAQREADNAHAAIIDAHIKSKQDARASAINKLAEIAGLTEEELASIL